MEDDEVALSEGESLEGREGVGGNRQGEEREEEDELVEVDERPERLHGRLSNSEWRRLTSRAERRQSQ